MPTVNIYYQDRSIGVSLTPVAPKLKSFLADKLSCASIKLAPEEISLRFLPVSGVGLMGYVDLDITAHNFPERVKKQDEICRDVAGFIRKEIPSVGDVRVWLRLCELGHNI
jgi:hypothetical protein